MQSEVGRRLRTLVCTAMLSGCAGGSAMQQPIALGPRVADPVPLEIATFRKTQWFDWNRSEESISSARDSSCRSGDALPDVLRTPWRTLNRFGTSDVKWTMACKTQGGTRALAELPEGGVGSSFAPTLVGPAASIHAAAAIRYVDAHSLLHLPADRVTEFNRALRAYSGDPTDFQQVWPHVVPARLHAGCAAIAEFYTYDRGVDMSALFCLDAQGHVGDVLLGPIHYCHARVTAILDLEADGTDEVLVQGCGLELTILDWDAGAQRLVERISGRALERSTGTPVGWRLPSSPVTTGGARRRR